MSHRASGFTDWVNVVEYGVVPSAVYNFASITVATFDLTISPAVGTLFTAADVGKAVLIQGAGTNSGDLWTTIATYVSPTHVTTTASAITDASAGTLVFWGHNANMGGFPSFVDQIPNLTNAINAAADATPNVGIYVPAGVYCYASSLVFGTIDAGDTLAGIRGSGQTYFVAQNPASATPQGFLNMTDLFGSMVYFGDCIVAGVTMPSTGSLTAGAEVI